jgi:hypothetical protein
MKKLILLTFLVACRTPETNTRYGTNDLDELHRRNHNPTPEEREEDAREQLKFAAEETTPCGKASRYQLVVEQYPETKAAKFAAPKFETLRKQILRKLSRSPAPLKKASEQQLTHFIETVTGAIEACPFEGVQDVLTAELETAKELRLERFGY